MFVQIAWSRIKDGAWEGLEKHYQDKVIPMTMSMPGLKERQLWHGTKDANESLYLSVWDSLSHLREYEISDARRSLAQEAEQFFHPLAYQWGETWIKHFEIVTNYDNSFDRSKASNARIAWGKLRLGAWDAFVRAYREHVEPTTGTTKGMGDRQLLRSTEDPDEGMTITYWESQRDLDDYENSDLPSALTKRLEENYRGEFWVKQFEVAALSSN